MHDVALAEQCERAVGQRGEVAARAERAVFGHDRRDVRRSGGRPSPGRRAVGHRCSRGRACGRGRTPSPARPRPRRRSPMPAACERTRAVCSARRRSGGIDTVASAPNPVEMPYFGSPSARRSTMARDAAIRSIAEPVSSTGSPRRATATTSSMVTPGPVEVDGHVVRSSPLMRSSRSSRPTASVRARSKSLEPVALVLTRARQAAPRIGATGRRSRWRRRAGRWPAGRGSSR